MISALGAGFTHDTHPEEDTVSDEQLIRTLIEHWAAAAHDGDLEPCSPTTLLTS